MHFKEEAEKQLHGMLDADVVEPSSSPWPSPIVLVRKKDNSLRYCIDYRKLNEVTVKDCYPIPRIDEALDCLEGASWFSTLDLTSGYWHERELTDKPKTAFITQNGLFQFF